MPNAPLPTVLALLAGALILPACATDRAVTAAGTIVASPITVAGESLPATWYLPAGAARGLAVVQPGFTRRCDHLRETTRQWMERGLMALCVDASMAGGNPALADALAGVLLSGLTAPDGRLLPERIVVAGHSAGAVFAARLGWQLVQSAPHRLAGAVMFDPVAANDFAAWLGAISEAGQRPVRAVTAKPGPCNAQNNADPALLAAPAAALAAGGDGFVGVQLTDRSTHIDAEGADTNRLAIRACGQGAPRRANTAALRELSGTWAIDAVTGMRTPGVYPGGAYLEGLISNDDARVLE